MKIKNIADSIAFTIGSIGFLLFGRNNKPNTQKQKTVILQKEKITANNALRSDWKKLSVDANIAVIKVKNKYGI